MFFCGVLLTPPWRANALLANLGDNLHERLLGIAKLKEHTVFARVERVLHTSVARLDVVVADKFYKLTEKDFDKDGEAIARKGKKVYHRLKIV